MQTITKAKISRENLMDYIHEDRDLLMGLQDDLSDMLYATGKFSIDLNEIVNEYMPHIPLYCLLYTSPSQRDRTRSRMPSSA